MQMPLPRLRHHPSPISGTSGVSLRYFCSWQGLKCSQGRWTQANPFLLSSSSSPSSSRYLSSRISKPFHCSGALAEARAITTPTTTTAAPHLPFLHKKEKFPPQFHSPLRKYHTALPSSSSSLSPRTKSPSPFKKSTIITAAATTPTYRNLSSPSKMPYLKLSLPSLKDIPSKLEVAIEGIDDGKVLLVKSENGTIHALSPRCTHYGAPLKGGVLEGERLTCPWHGACFNITTGDVEDAPALNALHKYEILEKDDGVYIQAEESDIKSGSRNPVSKCTVSGDERVVVVGGGSGTIGLIQSLRENKYTGKITILTKEPSALIIDRPKLSKALIPDATKIALRSKEWYQDAGIEILSQEVTSIDFDKKAVVTSDAKLNYTKLVLASGGLPKRLPLPGFDSGNIYTLRNVDDVQAILDRISKITPIDANGKKQIVVIGSSFIGMEVGNALATQDPSHAVTIIGMESAPMERVMGAQVGRIFQKNLEKSGVKFVLGASVEKAATTGSSVSAVHLKDGTSIPADIVILGVGVRPATDYLKDNQAIQLEGDGSIRTDENFAVSLHGSAEAASSVFAIGDIATFPYTGPGGGGSHTRIEHWNVAQNAGRSVARSIAGGKLKPKKFIPIFWSALGAQMRYVGNTVNGYDDIHISGEPDEGKFVAYYFKGEVVVAVATMGVDPVMAKVAALMRAGRMVGKKDVISGVDFLAV